MSESRQLAAVMFTDLVDSTRLAQTDERSALALIQEQERISRAVLPKFHGRVIKSTGDGLLAEFPSALDAVEGALALQKRIRSRRGAAKGPELRLRIGIHLGDVHRRGDDIIGDAVNIAARVQSVAEPGGICVSESVFKQVRNKGPFSLTALGPQSLKGVVEPIELYRVSPPREPGGERASSPDPPRLAVLPLANISPDPKDEYFADGLTEELISVLSKIAGLRVIARTSVSGYKSTTKTVSQIGSELGVNSILEGSVRKANDRLRITLQLIDVGSQEHVWAETYDRQLSDVFAIQSEVAESTAKAIRIELSEGAREFIHRPPTSSFPAYELYLRAVVKAEEFNLPAFVEALRLLEEAVRLDPTFALAHAHIGYLYVQGSGDYFPHRDAFERAREHIARALEIDANLSQAHAALGDLYMQQDHDWSRSEGELRRALELNPSNSLARVSYSTLLRVLGKRDEAEKQLLAAIDTSPTWEIPARGLVDMALMGGDLELAKQRVRTFLGHDLHPAWTHFAFAEFYAERKQAEATHRELEAAGRPSDPMQRVGRAIILAMLGETEEAAAIVRLVETDGLGEPISGNLRASLYSVLGEKEKALSALEQEFAEGGSGLWLRASFASFDPIRADPRFLALVRALHVDPSVTLRA